jgi:hypothetical protein
MSDIPEILRSEARELCHHIDIAKAKGWPDDGYDYQARHELDVADEHVEGLVMKLSERLSQMHDSGDVGNYLGGFAEMAEVLEDAKPKIKMTKTLPGEEGWYYWSEGVGHEVEIYDVELRCGSLFIDRGDSGYLRVNLMGGYWAKVDQSMFEFEGE